MLEKTELMYIVLVQGSSLNESSQKKEKKEGSRLNAIMKTLAINKWQSSLSLRRRETSIDDVDTCGRSREVA